MNSEQRAILIKHYAAQIVEKANHITSWVDKCESDEVEGSCLGKINDIKDDLDDIDNLLKNSLYKTIYKELVDDELRQEFKRLKELWMKDTAGMSSVTNIVAHPAYLKNNSFWAKDYSYNHQ